MFKFRLVKDLILIKKDLIRRTGQKSSGKCFRNRKAKELITKYLLNGRSMFWIFLKHFRDKLFRNCRQGDMVRKRVIAHLYFAISSLHIVGFKRRAANQTGVRYHSQTPDVHLI